MKAFWSYSKVLIIYLFFGLGICNAFEYQLSICAIFQNEAPYLKEWIEYHRMVGVEHFWLYNNNSTDDFRSVLEEYVATGVVELIEWPSGSKDDFNWMRAVQAKAYTEAISKTKGISKWLALIDIDEFIVPVQETKVTDTLEKRFSKEVGVCINWQNYGTSYISKLDPTKPMIGQLLWKMKAEHPLNWNFKSILQPMHVTNCENAHFCSYIPDHGHVNTHSEKPSKDDILAIGNYIDVLRINHYWTRDEEYFRKVKIPRYIRWGEPQREIIERANLMNEEKDDIILQVINRIDNLQKEDIASNDCQNAN